MDPSDPHLVSVLISLLGGLAIFILGMTLMTQALNTIAGARMKALLRAFTRNRFAAAATGATITAVVQSSSVTTVLLVGFSSAGLMSVAQSVGVILGANVGSTVTAQIIAFKIGAAGPILLAIGIVVSFLKKRERLAQVGLLILGLGAIFFGMQEMSDATRPLRSYEPFLQAMQTIESPLWGVAVGLAFTAVVQSSAASIGLAIIFANQGLLTLEGAIAIAFGANVGTCITAALAALGRSAAAWRIVFVHVLFNLVGVALWFAFIPQLGEISGFIGERLLYDRSLGREVAIAHTLFNVVNLVVFIGFTGPLARLAIFVFPERARRKQSASTPLYLDPIYLATPPLAIDQARLETGRLAALALRMAEEIPIAAVEGSAEQLQELAGRDDELDDLQTAILSYLSKVDASKLAAPEQSALHEVIALVNCWENVGDTLDNHMLALGRDRLDTQLEISLETKQSLSTLHRALLKDLRLSLLVTKNRAASDIKTLLESKAAFNALAAAAETALHQRLVGRDPQRMELFRLESDLISNFKFLHHHLRRPAKLLAAGRDRPA